MTKGAIRSARPTTRDRPIKISMGRYSSSRSSIELSSQGTGARCPGRDCLRARTAGANRVRNHPKAASQFGAQYRPRICKIKGQHTGCRSKKPLVYRPLQSAPNKACKLRRSRVAAGIEAGVLEKMAGVTGLEPAAP